MLAYFLLSALPQIAPQDIVSETVHELPYLGTTVREIRWLDRAAGSIRAQGFLADGSPVDPEAAIQENRRLSNLARHNVSPELWEQLAAVRATDAVEVVFWLKAYDAPDWNLVLHDAEAAGMSGEEARRHARDRAASWYEPRNQAFAAALAEAGVEVTQVTNAWPVVYARVPASAVPAWATHPAVDQAYYCAPTWEPELDDAQATMRTPIVWDGGLTASGTPVKTMVNDVGDVTTTNAYLPPVIKLTSIGVDSHASSVAGNICMNHPTYKGAAYGMPQLYSGGGSGDTAAPNVWNLAISNGVSYGNISWWNGQKGAIVFLDRFFDHTLRNYGMMLFKSNGNQGTTSTPYATTPGNGYNVTCSGSFNDGDDANWANDFMASYSSYWDPVEGHEKPELASPGDGVTTTGITGVSSGFGGTSSASPLTCGVATLLGTRDNTLMTRTESLRCILMVSAWHNVEAEAVLSEKDGAGAVHALAADNVVRRDQFVNGTLTNASFTNNVYDVPFQAYANIETRVGALWFSNANSSYSTDVLDMDVDLIIRDPSGATVATSASTKNPFELLAFTPTQTGTYTARLSKMRFNGASEPFCVAWSYKNDTAEAEVSITGSPKVGTTITMNPRARYQPSDWFAIRISTATLPNTVAVGSGFALPLRLDNAYNWSTTQAVLSGTLNASGQASLALTIPNNSTFINKTFYVAMYTKPNSGSATVDAVSAALPVTVLP